MASRSGHEKSCGCWRCVARLFGWWLDELGGRTISGRWDIFVTITFAMAACPWIRGFPVVGWKPNPEYASGLFKHFVSYLEGIADGRVDFAVADQLGAVNGRLHLHGLISAQGTDGKRIAEVQGWLTRRAGFNRVLPYRRGAAFYLSRFVGREIKDSEWDIRLGDEEMRRVREPARWGEVIVASADMPKGLFHQGLPRRRR